MLFSDNFFLARSARFAVKIPASTISSIRLSFGISSNFFLALRIISAEADNGSSNHFTDIGDPQTGWGMEPGSESTCRIANAELDMSVP